MKWTKISALFLLMALVSAPGILKAQQYQYHKIYIYNFTKYIQWPANKQSGDFVIGVYGKSQMQNELNEMAATRSVGGQKIIVKEINAPSDALGCHVLFIPQGKSEVLDDVQSKLAGSATLVITEKPGMAKQGSAINFVIVGGKLKYELNKASIDKAGLKVMPDLIKLAILVNS